MENSNIVNSGGIGRAIVGGLIAGDSGAIVGANTRKVKILFLVYQLELLQKKLTNLYIL